MILDQAEALAENAGSATLQEYCAELLARAIEVERVKHHMTEVEARRGPLEGFNEIAEDPDYLVEWQEQSESAEGTSSGSTEVRSAELAVVPAMTIPVESLGSLVLPEQADAPSSREAETDGSVADGSTAVEPGEGELADRQRVRITPARPPGGPTIKERIVPEVLDGTAIDIVRVHVGPGADPHGFLPSIRAGRAVPPAKVQELLAALRRIESDNRNASLLDRGLSYDLHRLAMESQVLLTEAWPCVLDDRTVAAIRAVQEMVERILSGQDIRYYEASENQERSNARE
jgi:hypothetical protein